MPSAVSAVSLMFPLLRLMNKDKRLCTDPFATILDTLNQLHKHTACYYDSLPNTSAVFLQLWFLSKPIFYLISSAALGSSNI